MFDRPPPETVVIDVEERDGLFFASCGTVPELYLSHEDVWTLLKGVPGVIQAIFRQRNRQVTVRQGFNTDEISTTADGRLRVKRYLEIADA